MTAAAAAAGGTPFWILGPGHAVVWYKTVFAFLAQHVLGEPWRRPHLL